MKNRKHLLKPFACFVLAAVLLPLLLFSCAEPESGEWDSYIVNQTVKAESAGITYRGNSFSSQAMIGKSGGKTVVFPKLDGKQTEALVGFLKSYDLVFTETASDRKIVQLDVTLITEGGDSFTFSVCSDGTVLYDRDGVRYYSTKQVDYDTVFRYAELCMIPIITIDK